MLRRLIGFISYIFISMGAVCHAAVLYTIGPDALFTPRALVALTTSGVPSPVANLGDGSIGFNGGLAHRALDDRLYSAGTSFQIGPQSNLYKFSTAGTGFASVFDLTGSAGSNVAFIGGLAYRSADDAFYLIANDSFGASSFFRLAAGSSTLEPLGVLGIFGAAGLTYNADDDKFYVIAADNNGIARALNSITLGVTPTVSFTFDLGVGDLAFNGGLAYDAANDLFYVIANDSLGNSSLDTFDSSGAGSLASVASNFGIGFLNASLALGPAGAPVPEPFSIALLMIGLLGLAATRCWRSIA